MKKEEEIISYLKQNLTEKRLNHSVGVSETAEKLALHYGCDLQKARIAGLVHDCARERDRDELLGHISSEGMKLDEMAKAIKELLHGPAAVYICKKEFNINDEEILSAVTYHTTGKENMTLLEKVVFLADYIEPTRSFEGVERLRTLAYRDLNQALLAAFDSTISYLISRKDFIHPDTIAARNYLLMSMDGSSGR